MSIETLTCPCVVVTCDRCHERLPIGGDEGSYAHYEDTDQALDEAKCSDWYVGDDGLLICLGCTEDAPYYEVACPKCGAAVEESCKADPLIGTLTPLFCEERIEALAAKVRAEKPKRESGSA